MSDDTIETLRIKAARYDFLKNGGWEVLRDPKYWTEENRFDGAIDAAMLDVALQASQMREPK